MCQVLRVSRSGYYAWTKRPESARELQDAFIFEQLRKVFDHSRGTYGSIRLQKALSERGIHCSRKRIIRLMRQGGMVVKTRRKFKATTNSRHNLPVFDNVLNKEFNSATRPNQVWVSDITYIWTSEGWLYLAAVVDLFSRKVVGWSMDSTMTADLVSNALDQVVIRQHPGDGLIHHSDRGSQYASNKYTSRLRQYNMIGSMSKKGDCYDNACMESFFATLKKELVYHVKFQTRSSARLAIFEYIEVFYNRQRLHSGLGYVTPECKEKSYMAA